MLLFPLVLSSCPALRVARVRPLPPLAAVASSRPRLILQWLCEPGQTRPRARWLTLA